MQAKIPLLWYTCTIICTHVPHVGKSDLNHCLVSPAKRAHQFPSCKMGYILFIWNFLLNCLPVLMSYQDPLVFVQCFIINEKNRADIIILLYFNYSNVKC